VARSPIAPLIGQSQGAVTRSRKLTGFADVTDVLSVAEMMAGFMGHEVDLELNMQGVKAFWRLGPDNAKCVDVMRNSAEEIAALRSALGD